MASKTITCSNVKQAVNGQWIDYTPGDTPIKGTYGFSLRIGYKNGEEWENYYVNDPQIFDQFVKGSSVVVEYEPKKSKSGRESLVVTGVGSMGSPQAQQQGDSAPQQTPNERGKSIELQTLAKAWAVVNTGKHNLTTEEFAIEVLDIWDRMFNDKPVPVVEKVAEGLVDHVAEAQASLDAQFIGEDDIPL